jgi:DNA-binding NarL/FixJ family response regulator
MSVRILVVEDYAPFRRITCAALQRRAEFEIFEAVDGLEALQKIEELQPDLILLDINLPNLHGFAVAARVGELAPRARLVFISLESSPDIVRHGFRLGGHGYIHKQRAGTDLFPAIDAVLGGQRFVSSSLAFSEPTSHPAPHRHDILFCSDDAAIIDGLARFVAAALNAGDAVIVLATESHRDRLPQELHAQGEDIDGAIERGTYVSFEADEAPDPVQFTAAINCVREAAIKAGKPHPRVAFCGERAGRLWAAGRTAEAVQLERRCGELPHDVDILCLYPIPFTEADQALERMCAEHTAVSTS